MKLCMIGQDDAAKLSGKLELRLGNCNRVRVRVTIRVRVRVRVRARHIDVVTLTRGADLHACPAPSA